MNEFENSFGVDMRRVAVASEIGVYNALDRTAERGVVLALDGDHGIFHVPRMGGKYIFALANVVEIYAYPSPLRNGDESGEPA